MEKRIGLLSIVGFFGFLAVVHAQTPTAATAGRFDGTYRFVSSAKVNQTYVTKGGQLGACDERVPGPLTVVQGRARYTSGTGRQLEGLVGSQGEFAMRWVAPDVNEMQVNGSITDTGTARARQRGNACSYDFVWQK
jgi:hypothetical protein